MRSFNFKKFLSLMLAVMMTITMMPLHAFAMENHEEHSENGTLNGVDSKPFEETVLLKQIKADIAKILDKYLGKLAFFAQYVLVTALRRRYAHSLGYAVTEEIDNFALKLHCRIPFDYSNIISLTERTHSIALGQMRSDFISPRSSGRVSS